MFLFGFRKPKNKFSLEQLKFLHQQLVKNPIINEGNKNLIVETLRQIAELMIWGDQHEENFFDFFLEKNILAFFLKILGQKTNKSIKVQIIQTLSILVENLRSETALYYILSNNHINDLITHKFDFSDEEVLAYYISFLKTLSLKLNKKTLQFFFNEQLNDFPLYTEALKFFNHEESMIRTSVRTLTLNIYKVEDEAMRRFILDQSVPYFSNLVWFINEQCRTLDELVISSTHANRRRLENFVAELLDLFYYIHDIFNLNIPSLSKVLCEHVLQYLMIPLFVASLTPGNATIEGSAATEFVEERISPLLSLFLLAQVFNIFTHKPLVNTLAATLVHPQPLQYIPSLSSLSSSSGGVAGTPAAAPSILAQSPTMMATMIHVLSTSAPTPSTPTADSSTGGGGTATPNSGERGVPETGDDTPTSLRKCLSTNDMQQMDPSSGSPPRHSRQPSASSASSPVRRSLIKAKMGGSGKMPKGNRFRDALLTFLDDDDRTVLGVAMVLYSMIKNPSTDHKLLETCGLFPYRLTKAKLLLAALVSSDIALTEALAKPSPGNALATLVGASPAGKGHKRMRSRELGLVEVDLTASTVPIPPPEQQMRRPPSSSALPLAFPENDSKEEGSPSSGRGAGPLAFDDKPATSPGSSAASSPTSTASGVSPTSISLSIPTEEVAVPVRKSQSALSLSGLVPRSTSSPSQRMAGTPPVANLFSANPVGAPAATTPGLGIGLDIHSGVYVWIEHLLRVLSKSQTYRLVTLQVTTLLLKELVYSQDAPPNLTNAHKELLEAAYDNAARVTKDRIAGHLGEIFLELFENELMTHKQLHFDSLVTDPSLLLPLSETPMSGLSLANRLPAGEVERTQKAIDALLVLRELKYTLLKRKDDKLPLKEPPPPKLRADDPFALSGTKHIVCAMVTPINKKVRLPRAVVLEQQTMLVIELPGFSETPEAVSQGVVRDIIPLQSIEIEPAVDVEAPAALRLTSHPLTWTGTLVFDDAAKCTEAKDWLERARNDWRNMKMKQILDLLNEHEDDCPQVLTTPPAPKEALVAGPALSSSPLEAEVVVAEPTASAEPTTLESNVVPKGLEPLSSIPESQPADNAPAAEEESKMEGGATPTDVQAKEEGATAVEEVEPSAAESST